MGIVQLKERQALQCWRELCQLIEREEFDPVTVEQDKKAIRFDYSSRRELAWQLGGAVSFILAAGLAAVFSVPLGFLITAIFVILSRTTDDYLLLDAQARSLCHLKTFAGREVREILVDFDQIQSVHITPVSQSSGSASWTEYRIEFRSDDEKLHSALTHTESRSKPRARRIGEALAAFLGVPLVETPQS